jgi:Spy/CpxP family protein refolding chaperone
MKPFHTWRGRLQAVALSAAAVALVAVSNVAARQELPGRPGGRGMREPMPFAQLNLSADQKTQARSIFEKHREAGQATMEQLRTARESLRSAIYGSATPDTARIEDLTNQVAELEAKALRARIATEIEVASILTDEQRQQMASMRPPGPRRGPRE